ncbi:helix-turn-helix domain-containing protein [Flavobacterium franklandianum]|uniref:Helix-turn-helix transcriptional regulator n=1 Tax=Flavobacterium franklandianum TaxID=2594430 RepID=A0A553C603_9FLAO|nr:helix-turn-helix transcriptional regulator [Flavobacterium franklandianum]TRX15967.1 helix-turn-helix transcriptional regulator [Flavobacterium franklandianum]
MPYTNIKEIREQKDLSAEYVAIQLEISKNEYDKIESGLVNLKLSKLDRLVKIIGVKMSDLQFTS